VIEMNDPPANTYTYEMIVNSTMPILQARRTTTSTVIVLTGVATSFSRRARNIKMLASVDPPSSITSCLHANETLLRLEHTPKLVIARDQRTLRRRRLEIAMAADLRIARKDAAKSDSGSDLGVLPGTGGTQRLSRLVGRAKPLS